MDKLVIHQGTPAVKVVQHQEWVVKIYIGIQALDHKCHGRLLIKPVEADRKQAAFILKDQEDQSQTPKSQPKTSKFLQKVHKEHGKTQIPPRILKPVQVLNK